VITSHLIEALTLIFPCVSQAPLVLTSVPLTRMVQQSYDTIPNETPAVALVSGKMIELKSLQTIVRIPGITGTISLDTDTTSEGNRTTPSYVAFSSDERLIGDAAKNQAAMNPKNSASASCPTRLLFFPYLIASLAVFDAKRLIGRRFECVLPTVSTPSPD